MSALRHSTLATRMVTAALSGCILGLLDFVLFELQGNPENLRGYVLFKPAFLGISMFSSQLLWFSFLAVLCLGFSYLAASILSKLLSKPVQSLILPFSAAALGLGTIALRVVKNTDQGMSLLIMILFCVVLVSYLFVSETGGSGRGDGSISTRCSQHGLYTGAFLLFITSSLIAPDAYSLFSRLQDRPESDHSGMPNILLVVMDTVRADHLSCYGYPKNTTPQIDAISQEGLLFLSAFSTAPWTLPSHASMFTGLYPSEHKAEWGHLYLHDGVVTLAEDLADAGYHTVGFTENPFTSRDFGLHQGFQEYYEMWRKPLVVRAIAKAAKAVFAHKDNLEYSARTVGLFEHWLLNAWDRKKPFFAFINFMAAHLPYYPRPGFSSEVWTRKERRRIEPIIEVPERFYIPEYRLNEGEMEIMMDLYDGEIAYLDSQIGNLVQFLRDEDMLDGTLLILTSDHGENFGDHGFIEHQLCLYNSLLHVPLIIRYPGRVPAKRVRENVSTVSLREAIGAFVEASHDPSSDQPQLSLLTAMVAKQAIFAEHDNAVGMLRGVIGEEAPEFNFDPFDRELRCVIDGPYKLISSSRGGAELYHVEGDFDERHNLVETRGETAAELSRSLVAWQEALSKTGLGGETPEVDDGTSEALRALGYAE